ncbi:MAG: hypothetical protein ACE5IJ_10115 [Thermoplasmata archaeon]
MNIEKFHVGLFLAVICLAILVSSFFLPWWTIERDEKFPPPPQDPLINVTSTHDFKLLGISTFHRDVTLGIPHESRNETAYFEIADSELDVHFLVMDLMVMAGVVLIALFLVLQHLSRRKEILRLISLILGFAVIFVVLGSAAYFHLYIPSEVGNSRDGLRDALDTILPNIQTFAGSDSNETPSGVTEIVWGPSFGWYSAFAVCIIMLFSIALVEFRPKED